MQKIITIRPSKVTPPAPGSLRAIEAQDADAQAAALVFANGTAYQFPERGDVVIIYHLDRLCRAPWPGELTLEEWARSARASRRERNATARQARARRARGNQCR